MARNNSKRWNENAALAVLITNIRGRKRKDIPITTIADATNFLVRRYGSYQAVAAEVSKNKPRLSAEMVRSFFDISRLDERTRKIVDEENIGIDVARRLYRIQDLPRRRDTAAAIAGLSAHSARHVIEYVLKSPKLSVHESKRRVLISEPQRHEMIALVIPIEKEEYRALQTLARRRRNRVTELASIVLKEYLQKNRIGP